MSSKNSYSNYDNSAEKNSSKNASENSSNYGSNQSQNRMQNQSQNRSRNSSKNQYQDKTEDDYSDCDWWDRQIREKIVNAGNAEYPPFPGICSFHRKLRPMKQKTLR